MYRFVFCFKIRNNCKTSNRNSRKKERKTDRQKEGKETNTSKQNRGKGDVSLVALQTQLFLSSKRNPKQKILYLLDGNASQTRIDPWSNHENDTSYVQGENTISF
jgi:hypothetical protein